MELSRGVQCVNEWEAHSIDRPFLGNWLNVGLRCGVRYEVQN